MEQVFGLSFKYIMHRLERMAATISIMQRCEKVGLEAKLASALPTREKVLYLDICGYDETPMLLSTKHLPPQIGSDGNVTGAVVDAGSQPTLGGQLTLPGLVAKTKLLQIQSGFACLVHVGKTPVLLLGDLFNPITALSRCTARNMLHALQKVDVVSQMASSFNMQCRCVCLDKAATNTLTEKLVLNSRPAGWQSLFLHCDCHIIHTCFKKTLELLDGDVSSLIKCALSIREGGKMKYFREALAAVVEQREVVFVPEPLPASAQAYKQYIIQLALARDTLALTKITLLEYVMTGDWRNGHALEYAVPVGTTPPSPASVKGMMLDVLLTVLCSSQPGVFPRHRWTGAEQCIAAPTLMLAIHNLLTDTYKSFLALIGSRVLAGDFVPSCSATDTAPPAQSQLVSIPEAAQVLPSENADLVEFPMVGEPLSDQSGGFYAALNSKHRQDTWQWLSSKPFPRLLLMQMIVIPLTDLLAQQLQSASIEFEEAELCKVAEALLEGRCSSSSRTFQLLRASLLQMDSDFMDALQSLRVSDIWSVFPAACRTVQCRALAHKLLARAGASVTELFSMPHQRFPVRLFQVLHKPEVEDTLLNMPACTKCSLTLMLQEKYKRFTHPECLQILQSLAQVSKTDISGIECRHSSIRRHLISRSLQTKTEKWPEQESCKGLEGSWAQMKVLDVGVLLFCNSNIQTLHFFFGKFPPQWSSEESEQILLLPETLVVSMSISAAQKSHVGGHLTQSFCPCNFTQEVKTVVRSTHAKRRAPKKCSTWSAFLRLHRTEVRGLPDSKALSQAYRQCQHEGGHPWQRVEELARAATMAGGKMHRSMLTRRQILARANKETDLRLWASIQHLPLAQQALVLVKQCVAGQYTCVQAVQLARKMMGKAAAHKQQEQQRVQSKLHEYEEHIGERQVQSLKNKMPDLEHFDLQSIPSSGPQVFRLKTKAIEAGLSATAWSFKHRDHGAGQQLNSAWQRQHLLGEDVPVQDALPQGQPSRCREAGVCLCSKDGQMLRQMNARLCGLLKKVFQTPERKKLLTSGNIVAVISLAPGAVDIGELELSRVSASSGPHQHVFGIPLLYMSPYRPTLQVLLPCRDDFGTLSGLANSPCVEVLGTVCLRENKLLEEPHFHFPSQATNKFVTALQGLQQLSIKEVWYIHFWRLRLHNTPIPHITPKYLPVEDFAEGGQLWPLPRTRKRRNTAPGWDLMLTLAQAEEEEMEQQLLEWEAPEALEEEEPNIDEELYEHPVLQELIEEDELLDNDIVEQQVVPEETAAIATADPVDQVDAQLTLQAESKAEDGETGFVQPTAAVSSGAASSHAKAPSLPPVFYGRSDAAGVVLVGELGKISYYEGKHSFEAVCKQHDNCKLTRTAVQGNRSSGRPLGLMASWLALPCTASDHKDKTFLSKALTLERRTEARDHLSNLPGGSAMMSWERKPLEGEAAEPTSLKGEDAQAKTLHPVTFWTMLKLWSQHCVHPWFSLRQTGVKSRLI
eukprot:6479738-Amphidinium_carterae.2